MKKIKNVKDAKKSKIGMGDSFGSGKINPMGRSIQVASMNDVPKKSKMKKTVKSLA